MPRMARVVVPGYPHHITQRGSRGEQTFFEAADYRYYLSLIAKHRRKAEVEIWAYCLMPNHVHFVAVPQKPDGLARLFRLVHHRYARRTNKQHGWQGHLWQQRFFSCVMDEQHLLAAVRYVELNPVRAGLCRSPAEWPWSSVRAHLSGCPDEIVEVNALGHLLRGPAVETQTGRPAAGRKALAELEEVTGRRLRQLKRGRKPAN